MSHSTDESTGSSCNTTFEPKKLSSVVFLRRKLKCVTEKEKVSSVVKIKRPKAKYKEAEITLEEKMLSQNRDKGDTTEEASEEYQNTDICSDGCSVNSRKQKIKDDATAETSGGISVPPKKRVIKINRSVFKDVQTLSSSEESSSKVTRTRQRRWSASKDNKSSSQDSKVSTHSEEVMGFKQRQEKIMASAGTGLKREVKMISVHRDEGTSSVVEGNVCLPLQKDIDLVGSGPSLKIDSSFTIKSSSLLPEKEELSKQDYTRCNSSQKFQAISTEAEQTNKIESPKKEDPVLRKCLLGSGEKKQDKTVIYSALSSPSRSYKHLKKEQSLYKATKTNFNRKISRKKTKTKEFSEFDEESQAWRHKRYSSSGSDKEPRNREHGLKDGMNRITTSKVCTFKSRKNDGIFSSHRRSPKRERSRTGSLYSDSYNNHRVIQHGWISIPVSRMPDRHSTTVRSKRSLADTPVSTSPCKRSKVGWLENHEKNLSLFKTPKPHDVLLVGDSIINGLARYSDVWRKYLAPLHALNLGIGGDQTQHVLWRLQNGELDCYPRVVVVHCGTNNINKDSAEDIVKGILKIVKHIRTEKPDAKVIVFGLLPRDYLPHTFRRVKIEEINSKLEEQITFSDELESEPVWFLRPEDDWVNEDSKLNKDLYHSDWLHLSEAGDEKLAKAISSFVQEILQEDNGK